jgi:small-conductance mechanosensitive channel
VSTSSTPTITPITLSLPEVSIQAISFLHIAFYFLLASIIYYLSKKSLTLFAQSGALRKGGPLFYLLNTAIFLAPILVIFYGMTTVSKQSLFVGLLFFIVFSTVLALTLIEPAKALFASLLLYMRADFSAGDHVSFSSGKEGEVVSVGPLHIILNSKTGSRIVIPAHLALKDSYEVHVKRGGPAIVVSLSAEHISRPHLEKLAHLCPYKRKDSDVRISTINGEHKLSIEINHRDCRPWVYRYFENHLQKPYLG